jgi:hypothetical protein
VLGAARVGRTRLLDNVLLGDARYGTRLREPAQPPAPAARAP